MAGLLLEADYGTASAYPGWGYPSGFLGLELYPSGHLSDPCHGDTSPENLGY